MTTELARLRELLDLRADVLRLRAALEQCEHQTHSLRVWNGHHWTYHPPQAGRIAGICTAARNRYTDELAAKKET